MTVSTQLELPLLSESQSQKATWTNEAIAAIESAVAGNYALDTSAATTPGDNVTIPFDDSNDASPRTALRLIYLSLTAGATASFNVIHPDNTHLFYCKNNTTQTATVKTAAGSGVAIVTGGSAILYCDGTDVLDISAGFTVSSITQDEDYQISVFNKPTNGQVIGKMLVGREVTFPANFTGSVGNVGTNPTADNVFTVKDDGTAIGTVTISSAGAFTFATSGSAAKVVAVGSLLTVENQATADATTSDVLLNLLGTITVAQ